VIDNYPLIANHNPPPNFDVTEMEIAFKNQIPVDYHHYWESISFIVSEKRFKRPIESLTGGATPAREITLSIQDSQLCRGGGRLTINKLASFRANWRTVLTKSRWISFM
jgi:hypothetical protein